MTNPFDNATPYQGFDVEGSIILANALLKDFGKMQLCINCDQWFDTGNPYTLSPQSLSSSSSDKEEKKGCTGLKDETAPHEPTFAAEIPLAKLRLVLRILDEEFEDELSVLSLPELHTAINLPNPCKESIEVDKPFCFIIYSQSLAYSADQGSSPFEEIQLTTFSNKFLLFCQKVGVKPSLYAGQTWNSEEVEVDDNIPKKQRVE